ncbi:MAG: dehydratase [Oscillospiraceae bacterium]|nr:dehydratase [Oscillospiraceae bacterium]
MNTYAYEEIEIGQEVSFEVDITEASMRSFREITGDLNPLHNDAEYAAIKGYPDRVVYGMLTASFLSTLAGMYMPGKNSLIYEVEVKFINPLLMRDGGNLTVSGKVSEKNDMFKRLVIKVSISNSVSEKILRGTMKVGVSE